MLNKAMLFFSEIQTGNVVQLSPSLLSELAQYYCDSYNENIERLYIALPNSDLIVAWADNYSREKKYFARLIKANITGLYTEDTLKVSYIGSYTNVTGRSFSYQIVDCKGWFQRLEFLQSYRFKDLATLRAFVHYVGSVDMGTSGDIAVLQATFENQVDSLAYEIVPATAA